MHNLPIRPGIEYFDGISEFYDFIFEGRGILGDDWYMNMNRYLHVFRTPGLEGLELAYALVWNDKDLLPFYKFDLTGYLGLSFERAEMKDCDGIKKKSWKALSSIP